MWDMGEEVVADVDIPVLIWFPAQAQTHLPAFWM